MQTFVFGILKRGNKADDPSLDLDVLQQKHLLHIKMMKEKGLLALAGPFAEDGDSRGIFIFNSHSVDEVKSLADSDPAVIAGRLKIEYLTLLVPPGTTISMGDLPI